MSIVGVGIALPAMVKAKSELEVVNETPAAE
jgi:hypothetical protein